MPKRTKKDSTPFVHKLLPKKVREELKRWRAGEVVDEPLRTVFSGFDVLRALIFQIDRWRVQQRAAGVAFFLIIGLVPTLMVLVLFADLFGLSEFVGEFIIDGLVTNLVPIENETAAQAISEWVNNARTRAAGGIGIIAALYSAFNVYGGIHTLVNDLWQVPLRGRVKHQVKAAVFSGAGILVLLALNTMVVAWLASQWFANNFAGKVISFLLMLVIATFGLRVMVGVRTELWPVLKASLIGTLAFEFGKYIFALYVSTVLSGSWFVIYGAIFLFPVFLLWCFVTIMIVSVTASLAWVLQEREDALSDAGIVSPYTIDRANFQPLDEENLALARPFRADEELG